MLPMFGPWADTEQFTNVALLEKLGLHSRDVAVGVLVNKHLTGPELARIAETANLTSANVEACGNGHALLHGRTAADQMAIVLGALSRSEAAAKTLCALLSPEASASVYRHSQTRFKGAQALRDAVRDRVASMSFMRHSGDPFYTDAITVVLGDSRRSLAAALRAAPLLNDPDALLALTDVLAAAQLDQYEFAAHVEALLVSTIGHPEVVTHWATHGGELGRAVAVLDHRQDPELLMRVIDEASEERRSVLMETFVLNPGVPYEVRAEMRGRQFATELMDCTAQSQQKMNTLVHASRGLLANGQELQRSTTANRAEIVERSTGWMNLIRQGRTGAIALPSGLLLLELLVGGRRNPTTDAEIVDAITRVDYLSRAALDMVQSCLPDRAYQIEYAVRQRLEALFPDFYTARQPGGIADPPIAEFNKAPTRQLKATEIPIPGAHLVSQRLSSLQQVEALYTQIAQHLTPARGYGRNVRLNQVITDALATAPRPVDEDAMVELFGNALGAF